MERSGNLKGLKAWVKCLGLLLMIGFGLSDLMAQGRSVAIFPFRFFGPSELSNKGAELELALGSELKKKGFTVVDPAQLSMLGITELNQEVILRLEREFGVAAIVEASITVVGSSMSLDGRVLKGTSQIKSFHIGFLVAQELKVPAQKLTQEILDTLEGVKNVASLEVTGNVRIEKDAIFGVMKTKAGERLNPQTLDEDIRAIYAMGYFEDVTVESKDVPEGVALTIKVVEKPSIGKIVFKGNKKISEEDLLKEFGVKQYSIYDERKVKEGILRLNELYKKKGYYDAKFEYNVTTLPNNQLELKVNIKEGEKIYIRDIEFVGNKVFSASKLKKVMETSEKGFFSWLTDSGILDKKKLDYDVQKLAAFYHNHGYINARVGEPKVEYTEKGIKITIEIFEGNKYKVRSVGLTGDIVVDEATIMKKLQMKKGEVFNREKLRSDVLTIMELTVDQGYAYAEVIPDIKQDDQLQEVDVIYRINKGQKVKINRIEISGNTATRDKVIRRELQLQEGDYYSGSSLRESVERLNRLGFFEEVGTELERLPDPEKVNLKVKIKEGHTGSLSFGGGYSSEVRGFIMSKISQQNFLGLGQTLTLSARLGGRGSEFDLSFLEPWLYDRPISLSTNAYRTTTEYDDFDRRSLGFGAGLGFPLRGLDRFTRGSIRYLIDSSDVYNLHPNASLIIRDMEGKNLTSSMTFTINRDTRNRAWNPSRGSLNTLGVEYAGGILGGDVYFTRYTLRSAWFFGLPWSTVFAAQGRLGYIEGRSGGKLPVYQKFMIGGINTVRGFDFATISPVDPVTGEKIGGTKEVIFNFEYQFPLIKEQGVTGLVFTDLGNVYESKQHMSLSGLRKSAGLGVRWYSPMGPLRLEWGKNLNPRPGEASSKWEFSVGTLF